LPTPIDVVVWVKRPNENTPEKVLPWVLIKQIMLMDVVLQLGNAVTLRVGGGGQVSDDEFLLPNDCVFVFHGTPLQREWASAERPNGQRFMKGEVR
jgi:hypothetical protein